MQAKDALEPAALMEKLTQLPDWRYGRGSLRTVLKCETSEAALSLFAAIGELAQQANHHPDVDWRYNTLFVTLTSHDVGSRVTGRDTSLAQEISAHSVKHGAKAHPDLIRTVEIAIDTDAPQEISSMWKTALGYRELADGSLVDPSGRGPAIWFQETETPNPNRLHLDITIPFDQSAKTLEALGQSGAILDSHSAPQFVVATDHQGNRLCICTEQEEKRRSELVEGSNFLLE
ncbi:pterin-4-alpha-carbinolamine dehydratase [Arthrobacter sp. MYb227]|nr:pterin-4-alpha-carbinolamine dehydratase [Arthrobacter sp. MYb227]